MTRVAITGIPRGRIPWTLVLVSMIIACAGLLLVRGAWSDSMTIDEEFSIHTAACIVNTGLIDLDPSDPQGARLLASPGVALSGVPTDSTCPTGSYEDTTYHGLLPRQTSLSQLRWLTFCARIGPMLVALALLAICAWWAFQLGGPVAAVLAAALIGFDPTFQAMGHLVSVDMALTFGFVACLATLWKWRASSGRRWLILAGLAMGFALLAKASGVLLIPIAIAMVCATAPGPVLSRLRRSVRPAAALVAVAYAELIVVYAPFRSSAPAHAWLPTGLNWLVPESWLWGMNQQFLNHVGAANNQLSYINGVAKGGGTWFYFLEGITLKSAIAALAAFAVGLGFLIARRHPALLWCVLPAGVYFAAASYAGVDIGLRYVTPSIVLFWLAAAVGIALIPRIAPVVAACIGVVAAATLVLGPVGSIGYFNAFAVGRHSYYLADSNIDWGQDGYRLHDWWVAAGKPPIQVDLFGGLPASVFVPTAYDLGEHPERGDYNDPLPLPNVLTVVSVNQGTLYPTWQQQVSAPTCTIGTSLVVVGATCSGS